MRVFLFVGARLEETRVRNEKTPAGPENAFEKNRKRAAGKAAERIFQNGTYMSKSLLSRINDYHLYHIPIGRRRPLQNKNSAYRCHQSAPWRIYVEIRKRFSRNDNIFLTTLWRHKRKSGSLNVVYLWTLPAVVLLWTSVIKMYCYYC